MGVAGVARTGVCGSGGGGAALGTVAPGVDTVVEFRSLTLESVGGYRVARAEVLLSEAS